MSGSNAIVFVSEEFLFNGTLMTDESPARSKASIVKVNPLGGMKVLYSKFVT